MDDSKKVITFNNAYLKATDSYDSLGKYEMKL
jgi:hypothetical protein